MNTDQQVNALQDMIVRLQDAEKGYKEIEKATRHIPIKNTMNSRAQERHQMHQALEQHAKQLGTVPEVKTSILGEVHRAFIDLKINNIEDDFEAISSEIERGEQTLIDDYQKVLHDVQWNPAISQTLKDQKHLVERELMALPGLKKEFSVEA